MSSDGPPHDGIGPPTADDQTRRRVDDLLSLLADRHRRDVLYHLATIESTDVETLATQVAAVHEGVSPDQVPSATRKQVQTDLVHIHLPNLSDAGAIEFDPRSEAIRCRELPFLLESLMETCRDLELEE